MTTSNVSLIWTNTTGGGLAAAEFWIGGEELWFTIFLDDEDRKIKIEPPSSPAVKATRFVDFSEAERLIESAKRDLAAISGASERDSPPRERGEGKSWISRLRARIGRE